MKRATLILDEHTSEIIAGRAAAIGRSRSHAARELVGEAVGNALRLRQALRVPLNQIVNECGLILVGRSMEDVRLIARRIQQAADNAAAIVAEKTTR